MYIYSYLVTKIFNFVLDLLTLYISLISSIKITLIYGGTVVVLLAMAIIAPTMALLTSKKPSSLSTSSLDALVPSKLQGRVQKVMHLLRSFTIAFTFSCKFLD